MSSLISGGGVDACSGLIKSFSTLHQSLCPISLSFSFSANLSVCNCLDLRASFITFIPQMFVIFKVYDIFGNLIFIIQAFSFTNHYLYYIC